MTIARELRMSKNTVKEYLRRFEKSGVSLTSVLNQHQTDFWY